MKIKLNKDNKDEVISKAVEIIKSGGLVVFPTETVYGLGADALNENAVKNIFKAKGRPGDNPVIVHISNFSQLRLIAEPLSGLEEKLVNAFWPGPFTIVLQKKDVVPLSVSGGLETVAVRMPAHVFARELIEVAGVPIAAPSANTSGRPSATTGDHVCVDLDGKVDLIVDAGISDIGLESTVAKVVENKVAILRAGAVTKEMIEKVLPEVEVFFSNKKEDLDASPGTRYRHYAPKAPIEIVSPEKMAKYVGELESQGKKVGVICTFQNEKFLHSRASIFIIGSQEDLKEISKSFYQALRFFDDHAVDVILCESFREEGIGIALMDRLKKATGKF